MGSDETGTGSDTGVGTGEAVVAGSSTNRPPPAPKGPENPLSYIALRTAATERLVRIGELEAEVAELRGRVAPEPVSPELAAAQAEIEELRAKLTNQDARAKLKVLEEELAEVRAENEQLKAERARVVAGDEATKRIREEIKQLLLRAEP